MRPLALILGLTALFAASAATADDAPLVINHEGRLLNADDVPVTGSKVFGFAFATSASRPPSGTETLTWSASYDVTLDDQGHYGVLLGGNSNQPGTTIPNPPLTAAAFAPLAQGPMYLVVRIAGVELSPRLQVSITPVAASALTFGGKLPNAYQLVADAASTYLAKTDAATTYLAQADATDTYLAKADARAGYLAIGASAVDSAKLGNAPAADYLKVAAAASTYLGQTDAAAMYLAKGDAAAAYLGKGDAAAAYLGKGDAAAAYLAKSDATTTYLAKSDAAATYLTTTTAGQTYATQGALTSGLAAVQQPLNVTCPVGQYLRGFTTSGAPTCGMALCPFGKADCNGLATDVCETSLGSATNCSACATGYTCVANRCSRPLDSLLLTDVNLNQINTWIGSSTAAWTLAYRATRDGATPAAFHGKVDNKAGENFFVAKLSTGVLIGGYTPLTWTSAGTYKTDARSFLFSLTNSFKHVNTGIAGTGANSIYDGASYGPTFGGGHDFYSNFTTSNYCNLGHGYACRVGSYGSTQCQSDFCGAYNGWTITELEVYFR